LGLGLESSHRHLVGGTVRVRFRVRVRVRVGEVIGTWLDVRSG